MSDNGRQDAPQSAQDAVHFLYTEREVRNIVHELLAQNHSYRQIAERLGGEWRGIDIYRVTRGYFPRTNKKRRALWLTPVYSVPPCPECGELHMIDECTQGKRVIVKDPPKPRKPRNRRAVNLDDPASAAATLRAHASAEFVAALVRELQGHDGPA